jgi:hypothetical protein
MDLVEVTAQQPAPPARLPRARQGTVGPLRLIGAAAAAAAAAVGLAYAVSDFHLDREAESEAPLAAASPTLPTKPVWAPITRPIQIYALDAADVAGTLANYEARRHISDNGREDVLSFGTFDGVSPYVRLSIYRAPQDIPSSSFFLDMARTAADAGLWIGHNTVASPLVTRFGPFEAADIALGASNDPSICLGFRFFAGSPVLRITGFYCGTTTHPADRSALKCLLNRLDLVSAGDDVPLRDFFVEAESRRSDGDCGLSRLVGQKSNWLEVSAAKPALREVKSAPKKARQLFARP